MLILPFACAPDEKPATATTHPFSEASSSELEAAIYAALGAGSTLSYLATVYAESDAYAAEIELAPTSCPVVTTEDEVTWTITGGGCTSDYTGYTYDGAMSEAHLGLYEILSASLEGTGDSAAATDGAWAHFDAFSVDPDEAVALVLDGAVDQAPMADDGSTTIDVDLALAFDGLPTFVQRSSMACSPGSDGGATCEQTLAAGSVDGIGDFTATIAEDSVRIEGPADGITVTLVQGESCTDVVLDNGETAQACFDTLTTWLDAWDELELDTGSAAEDPTFLGGGAGLTDDVWVDFSADLVGQYSATLVDVEVSLGDGASEFHPLALQDEAACEGCDTWGVVIDGTAATYEAGVSSALGLAAGYDDILAKFRAYDAEGVIVDCHFFDPAGFGADAEAYFGVEDCP
jgi:hypothetical protein